MSIKEFIKEKEFITIDGRILKMVDYFDTQDFVKSEVDDNIFIKYNALLRVTKKLFTITSYYASPYQSPEKKDNWCATVVVAFDLYVKDTKENKFSWSSCADCRTESTTEGFGRYTTALAETRAAARCLRSILGIDLCSAEEIADTTNEIDDDQPIEENQKSLLNVKFMGEKGFTIKEMEVILKKEFEKLDNLTKAEAATLIRKLNAKKKKKEK